MRIHEGNGKGLPHREPQDFAWDIGFRAERRGELHAALELYAKVVSASPESAEAWYNYGDVLLAMGRYDEAIPPLTKAVDLSPQTPLYHYDLGLALFNLDRHEEASREFASIVADDPQLERASSVLVLASLTQLAWSQDKLGRADKAANTLAPALQTAVHILDSLGWFKLHANRAAESIDLLQAASLLAPNSAEIVNNFGCALMRLKQRKKARSCFVKAVRLDPDYALPYCNLACVDAVEGKRNAAFKNLEKAVARGFRDIQQLRRDADLRSLRRDPRWKAIVARINELAKGD
jgi:Flp pilus assembly protein TadD